MGGLEEMALYADDILFLQDSDSSLSTAWSILNTLATFSGLRVNRRKSQVLPHKVPSPTIRPPINCPLQWVDRVKYLGLNISNSVSDFIPLNFTRVLQTLKGEFLLDYLFFAVPPEHAPIFSVGC